MAIFKVDGKVPDVDEGNARYRQSTNRGNGRKLAVTPAGQEWGNQSGQWERDDEFGPSSRHMKQSGRPTERYRGPQGYVGKELKGILK